MAHSGAVLDLSILTTLLSKEKVYFYDGFNLFSDNFTTIIAKGVPFPDIKSLQKEFDIELIGRASARSATTKATV